MKCDKKCKMSKKHINFLNLALATGLVLCLCTILLSLSLLVYYIKNGEREIGVIIQLVISIIFSSLLLLFYKAD